MILSFLGSKLIQNIKWAQARAHSLKTPVDSRLILFKFMHQEEISDHCGSQSWHEWKWFSCANTSSSMDEILLWSYELYFLLSFLNSLWWVDGSGFRSGSRLVRYNWWFYLDPENSYSLNFQGTHYAPLHSRDLWTLCVGEECVWCMSAWPCCRVSDQVKENRRLSCFLAIGFVEAHICMWHAVLMYCYRLTHSQQHSQHVVNSYCRRTQFLFLQSKKPGRWSVTGRRETSEQEKESKRWRRHMIKKRDEKFEDKPKHTACRWRYCPLRLVVSHGLV